MADQWQRSDWEGFTCKCMHGRGQRHGSSRRSLRRFSTERRHRAKGGKSTLGASLGRQMVSRCSPIVAKLAATRSPASRVGRRRWLAPDAWVTTSGGVETLIATQHAGARSPRRRLDAGIDFQLRRPTQNRMTVQTKRSASPQAQPPRRRRGRSPERRALPSRSRPPDSLRHRPKPSRLASLRIPPLIFCARDVATSVII